MTVATAITTLPRRQQLLVLSFVVAAMHVALLLSSGTDIWRFQSTSHTLAPLQTRVLSAEGASPAKPAVEKPPVVVRPVKRAPTREVTAHSQTAPDRGMQALASAALPAPQDDVTEPTGGLAETPATTTAPSSLPVSSEPVTQPGSAMSNAQVAKVGNFPDNVQINYKLTGQERGLNYYASGTLKWQLKAEPALPRAYEAELRVKAFLVGSRIWRSVGMLNEGGLSPTRYSDTARSERAAHFETDSQKISFSGNLPSAPLLPGAQDQVSLFIQMAATVSAQSFKPGAELTVQTATARDAANWTLTYKADEFIEVNGERIEAQRWVCLPRGKFDSQIEMWLAKAIGGLPARIKITQVSGNFIDMEMRGSEVLPALVD
jgi:hypothetical protein